ncbi:RING finger and CHY zinc finger domain-containing protein 1 [Melozone crissalis]|uniref:RING finger and CHY zinc finger domain-containing protein 1 n=1 Tax=Melozone crissalis TaxID=40204 RepID=UPI0023D987C0|nr:RING finger and CHY zinc finger domain-containing protein 1 [Melozone crissalis]
MASIFSAIPYQGPAPSACPLHSVDHFLAPSFAPGAPHPFGAWKQAQHSGHSCPLRPSSAVRAVAASLGSTTVTSATCLTVTRSSTTARSAASAGACGQWARLRGHRPCPDSSLHRIGPKEDFFHCSKCNLCLSLSLQGKHKCIENVSRQDCPICLEDIHTSRVGAHVLPCGHLLHRTCYDEMLKEGYRCPLCMHSALDMTRYWRQLDNEVAQTPMPTEYQNMMVEILCNDCNARSTVQFHLLGMKCQSCESYNTAQDGRCRLSLEEQ